MQQKSSRGRGRKTDLRTWAGPIRSQSGGSRRWPKLFRCRGGDRRGPSIATASPSGMCVNGGQGQTRAEAPYFCGGVDAPRYRSPAADEGPEGVRRARIPAGHRSVSKWESQMILARVGRGGPAGHGPHCLAAGDFFARQAIIYWS